MSTETEYIPQEDEVQASTSRQSWRCANGKICRGSEDADNLETREKMVGRLRRVGIFDASFDRDGKSKRVHQLEADIETASGPERIKASLCDMQGKDQASGVAIGLAWGLLQIAKDELMVITASQGTKKNTYGSYSTFVNIFTLKPGSKTAVEVPRRPRSEEEMDVTMAKLLDEIRTHPAFADRPVHESDDEDGNPTSHLSALCKEVQERGWPTPEQAPAEWLQIMAKAFNHPSPKASLKEHTDDEWGAIRLKAKDLATMPKTLQPALDRIKGGAPVVAGDLD